MDISGKELLGIEYIAALHHQMVQNEKILEDRLRSKPDAWRQFRIAEVAIEKVVESLYDTLDNRHMYRIRRMNDLGELVLQQKKPVSDKKLMFLYQDDVKVIVDEVAKNLCAYCVMDAKDEKKCSVRKALMNICPPEELRKDKRCPYSQLAWQAYYEKAFDDK